MTRPNDLAPTGISNVEYERRWSDVVARMNADGLDGIVLTNPAHIEYMTGHNCYERGADMAPFYLVISDTDPLMVARGMETASIAVESIPLDVVTYFSGTEDATPAATEALKRAGLERARVGFELDTWGLAPADLDGLKDGLPEMKVGDCTRLMTEQIDVKSPEEIAIIREAMNLTDMAFRFWSSGLHLGESEYNSQARALAMIDAATDDGVETLRAFTNTLFGRHTASPHGNASKRNYLAIGDVATLETGIFNKGYAAGYCRTAMFQGNTHEINVLHDLADEAIANGIDLVKPGVTAGSLDDAVRGVVEKAGRGSCYRHRAAYSHGFRWNQRGGFSARPDGQMVIEENMVLHVVCFLYDESGDFGVTTSDTVLVGSNGAEILSNMARDIIHV